MIVDLVHGPQLERVIFDNMKKYLFIIFGFFIVIYLVYLTLSVFVDKKKVPTTNLPTPTSVPINYPHPSGALPDKNGKIIISGVEVNNFPASSKKINDIGDLALSKNEKYSIEYFPLFDGFLISIDAAPFEEIKTQAESDFLAKLGVDKKSACKLSVVITTNETANPTHAGRDYALSFCPPY